MEMHCTLRELDPGKICEVGNCSLLFKDFYHVGLIEETQLFVKKINGADEINCYLKEATEVMKNESHPALFVMKYNEEQDGTTRAGHCMAIMPSGIIIDVQMGRAWEPNNDKHLKSVSEIAVWKVAKKAAKDWEEKCGFQKCEIECFVSTTDDRSASYNELD